MQCRNCEQLFDTEQREKEFREKMDLPAVPSHCPTCRHQRRMAFRNERRFYYRNCDYSGKRIIALYPQDTKRPVRVYDQKIWWDESQWDPFEYGRDIDFNRPFFEQYAELKAEVPRPSLHNTNVENAIYGNYTLSNKDCYLNIGSDLCESVFHTYWAIRCRSCVDVSIAYDSEVCYDCVDIRNCFNCYKVDNSEIMTDSQYCYDCKSCQDCFGCVGIRHKRYYILNEQLTGDEYHKRVQYLKENPEAMRVFLQRYEELKKKAIYCENKNIQCEDVTGDRLFRCRLCHNSYDIEKCDEVDHSSFGFEAVSSQDIDFFGRDEKLYESFACFGQYECVSTILCNFSHDVYYSEYCMSSHHLFGCIALRHKDFCILNKQYSKEEYEELSKKLINHMKETGEWGEFFPIELSPFPYNITHANKYYPLSKEEIESRGWTFEEAHADEDHLHHGPFHELPANEADIGKSIIGKVLKCEKTQKPYQIVQQEYEFLKRKGYAFPRVHPDVRAAERMQRHNPLHLWKSRCEKCGKETSGSLDPERGLHIYCHQCYGEEVIG